MFTRPRLPSRTALCLLAAGLLAMVGTSVLVVPHRAFGAEFDSDGQVPLRGPIVELEWVDPHTWILPAVTNNDGAKKVWVVEGGTPEILLRRGLRENYVQPGTVVVLTGDDGRARTGRANARDLILPDGRKFFIASSGTGALYDHGRR